MGGHACGESGQGAKGELSVFGDADVVRGRELADLHGRLLDGLSMPY
jgi:hypothetical protein